MNNIIDKTRFLVDSEYLNVVYVAGYSGNLALTTCVEVKTKDNSTTLHYKVWNWNDKLTRLDKTFKDYSEAHAYHQKLVIKFSKQ